MIDLTKLAEDFAFLIFQIALAAATTGILIYLGMQWVARW